MKNKKQILKKCCGKGGPMEGIKNTASGITGAIKATGKAVGAGAKEAASTFKRTLDADQKNLGFRDPGSYLNAGVRGLLGGVAGAAKMAKKIGESKDKISVQEAVRKTVPATPKDFPKLKTSVPLKGSRSIPFQTPPRTSVPLNAPTSIPAKKSILKKRLA